MAEHPVPVAWTRATITALGWTAPGPNPALKHALHVVAVFGPHLLKVVYRPNGADILVARAHFDRRAEP